MTEKLIIVGAGVVGLTTAIVLLQTKPQASIEIHSEFTIETFTDYPTEKSFVSPVAGAHIALTSTSDYKVKEYERRTYEMFMEIAQSRPTSETGIQVLPDRIYFAKKPERFDYWYKSFVKGFKILDNLPPNVEFGVENLTCCINPLKYLKYLHQRVIDLGGNFVKVKYSSFDEIPNCDAVFNCTGMSLDLVKNDNVYPVRGQIAVISKKVDYCFRVEDDNPISCYMIPRANGTTVLGGTFWKNDNTTNPRIDVHEKIIDRICQYVDADFAKQLRNGEIPAKMVVGLRPGRDEIRVEKEMIKGKVVIHCYGHTGKGYQCSWGTAYEAVRLLDQHKILAKF